MDSASMAAPVSGFIPLANVRMMANASWFSMDASSPNGRRSVVQLVVTADGGAFGRPTLGTAHANPVVTSFTTENQASGLAGFWADNSAGCAGSGDPCGPGVAAGLLDYLFTLALEVSGGGASRSANRVASDRAGLLRPFGAGLAEPIRTLVAGTDRTHSGFYFRRAGGWL